MLKNVSLTLSPVIDPLSLSSPVSSLRLYPSARLSRSETFHSLIVLSFVDRRKWAGFFRLSHRILFIFSSISSDLR